MEQSKELKLLFDEIFKLENVSNLLLNIPNDVTNKIKLLPEYEQLIGYKAPYMFEQVNNETWRLYMLLAFFVIIKKYKYLNFNGDDLFIATYINVIFNKSKVECIQYLTDLNNTLESLNNIGFDGYMKSIFNQK